MIKSINSHTHQKRSHLPHDLYGEFFFVKDTLNAEGGVQVPKKNSKFSFSKKKHLPHDLCGEFFFVKDTLNAEGGVQVPKLSALNPKFSSLSLPLPPSPSLSLPPPLQVS